MKQFSGLDLCRWVAKNKALIDTSRINQIYRQGINQICFALNTLEGKRFLIVKAPECVIFTDKKPITDHKDTGFGRWMRNNIKGGIINSINQVGSERILELSFNRGKIYIELFNKGNLICCDNDNNILITLKKQIMKDRALTRGEKYELPSGFDVFNTDSEGFKNHITTNGAELNISKFLAMKCNLGGAVAKQICEMSNIDPEAYATETIGKEAQLLKAIHELCEQEADFSEYEKELFVGIEEKSKEVFNKKLVKVENILKQQKKALKDVIKNSDSSAKIGEFIYNEYQFFDEVKKAYEYATNNNLEFTQEILDKLKIKYNIQVDMKYKKPNITFNLE